MAENRQRVLIAVAAILGVLAAVSAAAGQWRLAGTVAAVLLAGAAIFSIVAYAVSMDIRQRVTSLTTRVNELFTEIPQSIGSALEPQTAESIADRIAGPDEALASDQFVKQVSKAVKGQTREVEALLQLYRWVEPKEPMPPSGQWAMNPQGLLALFALVRRNRPRVVVELGSGTSTIWLAYALAANGPVGVNGSRRVGRLISIDHEPEYARQTRSMVALHADQGAPTEVRDAPLTPLSLGTEEFQWYSRDVFEDIPEIDMLIVDGPPGNSGPLARYPAIPVLLDRLADNAVIVLDDATRDDEKEAAQRWTTEQAGITAESSPIGRLAVFRYSSKA